MVLLWVGQRLICFQRNERKGNTERLEQGSRAAARSSCLSRLRVHMPAPAWDGSTLRRPIPAKVNDGGLIAARYGASRDFVFMVCCTHLQLMPESRDIPQLDSWPLCTAPCSPESHSWKSGCFSLWMLISWASCDFCTSGHFFSLCSTPHFGSQADLAAMAMPIPPGFLSVRGGGQATCSLILRDQ